MALWKFKAYHLAGGHCPIREWYRQQDCEVQAEFDAALTILRATDDWMDTQLFEVLRREHEGLGEIRFKLEKPTVRRFRPVGIWPPLTDREFILLIGCEKGRYGRLIPSRAFDTALEYRRRFMEKGEGTAHDYDV